MMTLIYNKPTVIKCNLYVLCTCLLNKSYINEKKKMGWWWVNLFTLKVLKLPGMDRRIFRLKFVSIQFDNPKILIYSPVYQFFCKYPTSHYILKIFSGSSILLTYMIRCFF